MPHSRTTTEETRLDDPSQRFLQGFRERGLGLFDQRRGLPPGLEGFEGASRGLTANFDIANQRGLEGLDQFLDPTTGALKDSLRPEFERMRQLSSNRAGAAATRGNAFGGSRQAVLEAIGQGDINRDQTRTFAGIDASSRASSIGQLFNQRDRSFRQGQTGLQNLFGLSQFRDQRQLAALQALSPGLQAGGRTRTTSTPIKHRSFFSKIAGPLALGAGAFLGGPGGAALGSKFSGLFGGEDEEDHAPFDPGEFV